MEQMLEAPFANFQYAGPAGGMPQQQQQQMLHPSEQPVQRMQPVPSRPPHWSAEYEHPMMMQSARPTHFQSMSPSPWAQPVQPLPTQPTQLQSASPGSKSREQVTDLLLKVMSNMQLASPKPQDKVTDLLRQLIKNDTTPNAPPARSSKVMTHQEQPYMQNTAFNRRFPSVQIDQGFGYTAMRPGANTPAPGPASAPQKWDGACKGDEGATESDNSQDVISTSVDTCTSGTLDTMDAMEDPGDLLEACDEDGVNTPASPQRTEKPAPKGPITTLMVRNVPVMYTQDMLLEEWPDDGTWDFLYLPRSCGGQANLSYAFINFITPAHARAFRAHWQKKKLAQSSDTKQLLNISFADVQGMEANLMQLKKKRVRRIKTRQSQPIIIQNGQHILLEEAMAALEKQNPTGSEEPATTSAPTLDLPPGLH